MKSKLVVSILIATVVLTGCSSKGTISINNSVQAGKLNTVPRVSTNYHFTPVKPGTVKPLNQSEKSKANEQVGSAIKNLNSTLKSVQDVPDIDISAAQN